MSLESHVQGWQSDHYSNPTVWKQRPDALRELGDVIAVIARAVDEMRADQPEPEVVRIFPTFGAYSVAYPMDNEPVPVNQPETVPVDQPDEPVPVQPDEPLTVLAECVDGDGRQYVRTSATLGTAPWRTGYTGSGRVNGDPFTWEQICELGPVTVLPTREELQAERDELAMELDGMSDWSGLVVDAEFRAKKAERKLAKLRKRIDKALTQMEKEATNSAWSEYYTDFLADTAEDLRRNLKVASGSGKGGGARVAQELQAELDSHDTATPPPSLTAGDPEPPLGSVVIDATGGVIVREAESRRASWYAVSDFEFVTWPDVLERGPLRLVHTPDEESQ